VITFSLLEIITMQQQSLESDVTYNKDGTHANH
jgi:hypothetical protein